MYLTSEIVKDTLAARRFRLLAPLAVLLALAALTLAPGIIGISGFRERPNRAVSLTDYVSRTCRIVARERSTKRRFRRRWPPRSAAIPWLPTSITPVPWATVAAAMARKKGPVR